MKRKSKVVRVLDFIKSYWIIFGALLSILPAKSWVNNRASKAAVDTEVAVNIELYPKIWSLEEQVDKLQQSVDTLKSLIGNAPPLTGREER